MSLEGRTLEEPARTVVMVLTHNGRDHLEACFESLRRLEGGVAGQVLAAPTGAPCAEVWLVDNGSNDGSADLVSSRFPWVKVLRYQENLGFPLAYNRAAAAADAEWIVLLNDDTRVPPQFLSELHRTRERRGDPFAIGARMMSWDGSQVDFAGADTFFTGHAWQRGFGEPGAGRSFAEKRLLFGCAGAMMVRRKTFLDLGGFDPDYFSFFEDVDLGWRATLLGHETWLAPDAVAYHAHHGSWSQQPRLRVVYLTERNALATAFKNYHDGRMGVMLLIGVALTFLRAWHSCDRCRLLGQPFLSSAGVVQLLALGDFAASLPALRQRRALVQAARRRSDEEVLELFGAFASPPDALGDPYRATRRSLAASAGISDTAVGGPYTPELNALAADAAGAVLESCREAVSARYPTDAFLAHGWDPGWEHEITPADVTALQATAGALERLAAGRLDVASLASLRAELGGARARPGRARAGASPLRRIGAASAVEPADRPTVTIVVRTKDRPEGLRHALASLAAQTQRPDEVVVVDDGEIEPTPVLQEFPALAFTVVTPAEPLGRTRAAQLGLETASGGYVGFLDDDDELLPDHLSTLARAIAASGARVAYADVGCAPAGGAGAGADPTVLGGPFDRSRLLFENTIPIMAVLAERAVLLEVGGFDPALDYFEDWDLWLRVARRTPFQHCPVVTAIYHLPPPGEGGGLAGNHRWPALARLFDRHREAISGTDWARFYQRQIEPVRQAERVAREELARTSREAETLRERLHAVEHSRGWRLYQWARRMLGRR